MTNPLTEHAPKPAAKRKTISVKADVFDALVTIADDINKTREGPAIGVAGTIAALVNYYNANRAHEGK